MIIATGGFGADYTPDSLLAKHRPELRALPTTNGDHCTGDGIKMAQSVGAGVVDMTSVQVHPTGLVNPDEPDAKVKFLAAEALRGVGGILLDANGERFCDELGRRIRLGRDEQGQGAVSARAQREGVEGDRVALQALRRPRDHEEVRQRRGGGERDWRLPAEARGHLRRVQPRRSTESCPFGKSFSTTSRST